MKHSDKTYICKRYYRLEIKNQPPLPKIVPGFSTQSNQKNVVTDSPPKAIVKRSAVGKTLFRMYYNRGDIPVCLDFYNANKILWKVDVESLDYKHYLPIFFDGLREIQHPYKILARQGISDMLQHGQNKLPAIIPQIVIPIKKAFNTGNIDIICCTLRILQQLVLSSDILGEALVPYYRQILPSLNVYRNINVNVGDGIDYGQRNQLNVGDTVQETLQVLERHGGSDAFIHIKHIIPTYQTCLIN